MKGEQLEERTGGEGIGGEEEQEIVRPSDVARDKRRQSVAEEGGMGEGEASGGAEARHVAGWATERLGWKDAKATRAEDGK